MTESPPEAEVDTVLVDTLDVGDRVGVAVWRPTPQARAGEAPGGWSAATGRVVSVRRDGSQVCYETTSQVPMEEDTPTGTPRRFAKREHVFETFEAAVEACRTLPPPTQ